MRNLLILGFIFIVFSVSAQENKGYTYQDIAKRFPTIAKNNENILAAQMQGECLVGLKQLNYRKQNDFDPIAEWSSFRSISLLEQFPPCEVLIMLEVAQKQIRALEDEK